MKKVVVTGASGFIGKAFVKKLLSNGNEVYAVVRNKDTMSDIEQENLITIECCFQEYGKLSSLIPYGVDWFVHFAWAGISGNDSKNLTLQTKNIDASVTAIEQATKLGVQKFLFSGSSYQYRMEATISGEQKIYQRRNIYGVAKQACTDILHAYSALPECTFDFNSIYFTNVFGCGDKSNRSTNSLVRQLIQGKDLNLIQGNHLHDWTYIDDAIDGIYAVLERGKTGRNYYIGSRKLRTFREIITDVRNILAPDAKMHFGYYDDDAYIDYSEIDLSRLYEDTGFQCEADFQESILKTAEWLKTLDISTGI